MRLKKKYRNLLRFIAVTLILILMISVVAAAKQHIDNKKVIIIRILKRSILMRMQRLMSCLKEHLTQMLSHMMEFQEQYRAGVIR